MKRIHKPQRGFTLVELLVGAAIGLFLIGAMIQSYLSTKETYNITQSVNRIQEDSRFAQYFISRSLRETNNLGCIKSIRNMLPINNLTDLKIKVGGWDYENTASGDAAITLTGTYANSTAYNKWAGLNNGTDQQLPSDINSISHSDSILVKKITPIEGVTITATGDNNSITVTGYTPAVDEVLIIGNCQRADYFQVDSNTTGTVVPTGSFQFGVDWDNSARLYSVRHVNYHVGLRAGADVPSLYRKDSMQTQSEELVEGVESLQVLYGLDSGNDGYANQYLSGADVTASQWEDIVSVRVGLLFVAIKGKDISSAIQTQSYTLADGIDFDAGGGDRSLRYVTNSTIKTRNLGLKADFSVCDAGVAACDLNGFELITTP